MPSHKNIVVLWAALTIGLVGCSSGGKDEPSPQPQPQATTYTVGGNVAGNAGNLILQLNGANNLTVGAAGIFTFGSSLASGTTYTVTVLTPPAQQACTVGSGTGTIAGANVTNVSITCANIPELSGTVAVGTPLVGHVTVKDSLGATRTAAIGVNGSYSIDVEGMTPPFVLRAEGTANGRTYAIHSAAVAADLGGNINVTQLTDLAISNIPGQIASAYFDTGDFSGLTPEALNAEITQLRTRLLPVLQALGVDAAIDLLRARFTPAESALDAALDVLRVSYQPPPSSIAIISNVVTAQQIQDDLAIAAAAEASAPVMDSIDHLDTAAADRDAVQAAIAAFGNLFADSLPPPALLEGALSPEFLDNDVDRETLAAELASDSGLLGSQWTDVDIKNFFYDAPGGAVAVVDLTIRNASGRSAERVRDLGVRREADNVWRIYGNQRVLTTDATVFAYRNLSNGCTSTMLSFDISDENPANNGGPIDHVMIHGPGLPQGGVRFVPNPPDDDWLIDGNPTPNYELANTCGHVGVPDSVIVAIPDDAIYLIVPYSSSDNSVRHNFPTGAIQLPGNFAHGTYWSRIARRPLTLAELATTTAFPTITTPSNGAALANYNGGPRTITAGNFPADHTGEIILQYATRLGNGQFAEVELAPEDDNSITTELTLTAPPAGDAITYRSVRVSTEDAYWREFMTGYEERYYTVSGNITGLVGSATLRLNGAHDLVVNGNGPFAFGTSLVNGAGYLATISAFPTGQACAVIGGAGGVINNADVTNLNVVCTHYSFGGNVSGLTGTGLVLQINGANDLAVPPGASFAFPTTLQLNGTALYSVHIAQQPAGQTCTIIRSSGAIIATPTVSNIGLSCIDNDTEPLSGTYRLVSYSGAPVDPLDVAYLTFYPDGTYIFGLRQDQVDCEENDGNGIEYGVYDWDATSHEFAFVTSDIDTNGECGIGNDGVLLYGTLVQNADGTLTGDLYDTNGSGDHFIFGFAPVISVAGEITGSWGDNQGFVVFGGNGTIFHATSKGLTGVSGAPPGIEHGCYTVSGGLNEGTFATNFTNTCAVNGAQSAVDMTGAGVGFSGIPFALPFSVSGDEMTAFAGPMTPLFRSATRIVP